MSSSLVVLAPQALLPDSETLSAATIEIDRQTGLITAITPGLIDPPANVEVLRIDPKHVVLPGLIDTHVHLNQPGRTAWEGFQTGTQAAVSGGVTTLIDMPLNSIPPTTTVENLNVKRTEARNVGVNCDIGFWGGIIPGNAGHLRDLIKEGVKGFKCFLCESGVDEFPCVEEKDIVNACEALNGTNALVMFHAELGSGPSDPHQHDPNEYSTFLSTRPESLETDALSLILRIANQYPTLRFHIVHLSAASALPLLRKARKEGLSNLTVETCFHYLTLRASEISPGATQFKCCPPIRDEANRQQIVGAVLDGTIDYVVSDHSPCIPELKRGDFISAWGGVSGLGLGLQLLWTKIGQKVGLKRTVDLLCGLQAKQVGLEGKKGSLEVGRDGDFVIFDADAEKTISLADLQFKNKVSPYIGKRLKGVVKHTYIRGNHVWDGEKAQLVGPSSGTLL